MLRNLWTEMFADRSWFSRSRCMPIDPRGGPDAIKRKMPVLALTTLVVSLGSCSAHEGPNTGPSSAESGETSVMIGHEGGTVTIDKGPARGTKLEIPRGALSSTVRISARPTEMAPALPMGVTRTTPIVNFQPDGLIFAIPATLTLPANRHTNVVYERGDKATKWASLTDVKYDPAKGVVLAQISHFCDHTGGDQPTPPPATDQGTSNQNAPPAQSTSPDQNTPQNNGGANDCPCQANPSLSCSPNGGTCGPQNQMVFPSSACPGGCASGCCMH